MAAQRRGVLRGCPAENTSRRNPGAGRGLQAGLEPEPTHLAPGSSLVFLTVVHDLVEHSLF